MNRDRHSHRHSNSNGSQHGGSNWKNSGSGSSREERSIFAPKAMPPVKNTVTSEQIKAEDAAIVAFKNANQPVCARCGKPITDLSLAIGDRGSGTPIHFDCAVEALSKEEKLGEGDKIAYIGQGRFGVINYPNVHDVKHFTIKKIIDWEQKDERSTWRNEMSDLYSQIR